MNSLKTTSRLAVGLAALSLIATYFLPVWRIDLWAPQYPEGLVMKIWLNRLSGDVEIINGLNHYIGMAHIREDMFPEFKILPYVVGAYILFGLLVALVGRLRLLVAYLIALALFGVAALYDFWRWGYQYGHELDPKAPIQVPGMSYQPPLIGYKQLLNFGAYSVPDVGGWVIVAAGLIIAGTTFYELYSRRRRSSPVPGKRKLALVALVCGLNAGCSTEADPIRYGSDACHHCKMSIVDRKFAAAYVTQKGKTFKFDDLSCLLRHQQENKIPQSDLAKILVADYTRPGTLIDARTATFRQHPDLRSPMGGNTAAFATPGAAAKITGKTLSWNDLRHAFE